MKRLLFLVSFLLFLPGLKAQDYSIIPTNPNAQGSAGGLFLAQVKIQNNSNEDIFISFERIVNNLPAGWTSCFCYPQCIAPWIDTLTFSIGAFSEDSIMPNFGTDSIPAMATVVIVLHQSGYESVVDTITFTGSTLASGTAEAFSSPVVTLFPNPFTESITLIAPGTCTVRVMNVAGGIVYTETMTPAGEKKLGLEFLPPGAYYLEIETAPGIATRKKIIKSR